MQEIDATHSPLVGFTILLYTRYVSRANHFPLLCHSIFLSTQPAPDADSLGIGFNDSSTDSFVRTVELGNLRAVQGIGSVHLVIERLRAGDWHLVFYCSSFAHHLLIMADGLMVFDSVWSRLHIIWYELLWFDGLSCQTCADYMHIRCRFSCSSVAPVSTLRDTGELHHCVSRASISDSPKSRGHTWTRDDIKWTWDIILIFIYIYIYIYYVYMIYIYIMCIYIYMIWYEACDRKWYEAMQDFFDQS